MSKDNYKDTIAKLKEKILMKRIKSLSENALVLTDDTKIIFECTDWDCDAGANGRWQSAKVDGIITDVQLVDLKEEVSDMDESQMVAKLVVFHNQNPIAQANLEANNGNENYYYSVLSVFVNSEEIGVILESW